MTISLALIVAPTDDEAKKLNNCLASAAPHVDEICITITGKNDKVEKVARRHKAKIQHIEWEQDFAKARNFNFKQCTGDWILWLDADDILWHGEKLKDFIKLAEKVNVNGLQIYYEYGHDDNGNVIDAHWKTQLVKNDGSTHWVGRIHEDLIQKRACTWSQIPADQVLRIHTAKKEDNLAHHERNLVILEQVAAENPEEPRTYIYLGRSYLATGRIDDALRALSVFVSLSGWDEERYEAKCLMGECYEKLGMQKEALMAFSDALLEDERCPKAYIFKARIYLAMDRYKDVLTQLGLAQSIKDPKPGVMQLPHLMDRDAPGLAAIAHLHLGNFEEAYIIASDLHKRFNTDKHVREVYELTARMWEDERLTRRLIGLYKLYNQRYPDLYDNIKDIIPENIKDDPRLAKYYVTPTTWGDKSIVIYCGISAEPWLPGDENGKGIGGSETAVIELAKRLAKMGWEVTVYNHSEVEPEGRIIDGVHYKNHWQFVRQDKFNVLWIWRMPQLLDVDFEAKKLILDMHDVSSADEFTPERVKKVDKIFVKTQYHRSLYPQVPDEKFVIVGNGIDLARFDEKVERNPHKIIYSSTPNRGLENILDIWPDIRKQVPDAELHVFYGWNTFYALEKDNPVMMEWMKKMQDKMKQNGIYDRGRVGQKELAIEMLSSSFWLYPTEFPEIHCITACEMQAAGVYPMTTGFAALAETQKVGFILKGDPKNKTWQQEFTKAVVQQLKDGVDHKRVKDVAKEFSWDDVAKVWDNELR